MADDLRGRYVLRAEALPGGALAVFRFVGDEAISTPFEMRIDVVADDPGLDGASLPGAKATLDLGPSSFTGSRLFHGVLSRFRFTGTAPDGRGLFSATLRPRLWLLSRSRRSRIFATEAPMSIPDIVVRVLEDDLGLTKQDYDLRLTADYPEREHVVQYQESDLAFVSRLLEHWGIAYFFEHSATTDRLILTDRNVGFHSEESLDSAEGREHDAAGTVGGSHLLRYHPGAGMAAGAEPAIHALAVEHDLPARQVALDDYNYRLSHVRLHGESPEVPGGVGSLSAYGDHFKRPVEGKWLARVRLEEANTRCALVEGTSNVKALRAGTRFPIAGHPQAACNGPQLFLSIRHEGADKIAGLSGFGGNEREAVEYRNTFRAIPAATPFRPARTTPRPRIDGVMNAFVDAAGDGERAEIDEHGRYKVQLPFDVAGKPSAQASRWVRMAQPYGGAGHGLHFPVLKGTEVLLTFVDGDPDRPIISGVVPNPQHPSVVTARNAHRNVLRSVSGVEMEFNDGAPSGAAAGSGASGAGAAHAPHLAPQRHAEAPSAAARLAPQRQAASPGSDYTQSSSDEKWARITVPHYAESNTSYVRLGSPDGGFESADKLPGIAKFKTYQDEKGEAGWLDYTDGGRFSYTGGDLEAFVEGEFVERIGDGGEAVMYHRIDKNLELKSSFKRSHEYHYGDKEDWFAGYSFDAKCALTLGIFIGAKLEVAAGLTTEVHIAHKTAVNYQGSYEYNKGDHETFAKSKKIITSEKIVLSVDAATKSAAGGPFTAAEVGLGLMIAGTGAFLGTLIGAIQAGEERSQGFKAFDTLASDSGMATAAAANLAAAITARRASSKAARAAQALSAASPTIEITSDKVFLRAGSSWLEISDSGIVMICGAESYGVDARRITVDQNGVHMQSNSTNQLSLQQGKVSIDSDSLDLTGKESGLLASGQKLEIGVTGEQSINISESETSFGGQVSFGAAKSIVLPPPPPPPTIVVTPPPASTSDID